MLYIPVLGRQADANRLEHAAGAAWCLRPHHEALGALIDGDLLDAIEIAHDIIPPMRRGVSRK